MQKQFILLFALVALVFVSVACNTSPTPTPTPLPTLAPRATPIPPTNTSLPPTAVPTLPPPTTTSTVAATVPPTAVAATNTPATIQPATTPTTVPSPTTAPTPTTAPSPTIAPSPTSSTPPGLYVTNLRIEPNPPIRGPELNFYATFANTTSSVQNYKWLVYIYKADTPTRSFGETSALQSAFPTGTGETKSLGFWKLPLGGPCDYFFARVAYLDINNKGVPFTTPDGAVFEKGFTVCPP